VSERVHEIGALLRALRLAQSRRATQTQRTLGVSPTEEHVLQLVVDGVSAPTALSEATGMTTAGMTNLLDRLEADGYLRRERHQEDGRRVLVSLTKKGFQLHLKFDAAEDQFDELARSMGPDAYSSIARFLADAARLVERTPDVDPA
jgi:DNA-binding MarR family transcriptional regulator